eukprot:COSAG02_NODE_7889_length_2803_cov_28.147189_3_plen_312_part_00
MRGARPGGVSPAGSENRGMATTVTDSPAFAGEQTFEDDTAAHGDGSNSRADLEAALALLNPKDGDQSQTVEAIEATLRSHEVALRAEFEAKLAKLEDKLAESGGPLSSAARSVVAHLSEAPPNWHQATVLFASSAQEPDGRLRAVSLAISVLIVASQSMVAVGMLVGSNARSCHTSDDCETKGMYCVDLVDRCVYCGEDTPLPLQTDPATGGTLNWVYATDYIGFNTSLVVEVCANPTERLGTQSRFTAAMVARWCETCMLNDGRVDDLTVLSHTKSITDAMGPFDWIALILSTVVVALTVGGELKVRRLW